MLNTLWMFLFLKNVEKYGKNRRFSGQLRLDWGHTARGAMAGLGSVGLKLSLKDLPPNQAKASSTAMITAVHCL